jgi:hypothetical protein
MASLLHLHQFCSLFSSLFPIFVQTLYSAWCAGALTETYLRRFLDTFWRQLRHVELAQLTSGLWTPHWDRSVPL